MISQFYFKIKTSQFLLGFQIGTLLLKNFQLNIFWKFGAITNPEIKNCFNLIEALSQILLTVSVKKYAGDFRVVTYNV